MSAKIKILIVIECGGPGGTGNQTAALCRGLDKNRFEVHLAYAVRPGASSDVDAALAGAETACHFVPQMRRELCPIHDSWALLKLFFLIRKIRPDVVHGQSSKGGFLARLAAWAAGTPNVFYSPRGYGFLQTDRSALSRALYRWLEISVSWIGTIVAVSQSEADLARELPTARRVVVVRDAYLGSAPAARAQKTGEEILVVASGRMSFPRHPEAFPRLAARCLEKNPNLRFLWIGDGELRGRFESLRMALRVDGKLEATGWLDAAAVAKQLAQADIFVHYSRWEGLPNAVLEAMAWGLPVAASDIPGNRSALDHEATGLFAADEGQLAGQVLRLAADSGLRSKLGRAGAAKISAEFQPQRMVAEHETLYLRS